MDINEKLDQKLKDVYRREFPRDPFGEEISETATFRELVEALNSGRDVYEVFVAGDSIIRERLLGEIAEILGVDYDIIYYTWLDQKYILSADGCTENPDYIDPETTPAVQNLRAFQANRNSRTDVPERICPCCHKPYRWEPGISQLDGVTEICPQCEALMPIALELAFG